MVVSYFVVAGGVAPEAGEVAPEAGGAAGCAG
jgi:hypothetical protein